MERSNWRMAMKTTTRNILLGFALAVGVLALLAAVPSQTDFDGTYFKTNTLPISLVGNLVNWQQRATNTFSSHWVDSGTSDSTLAGTASAGDARIGTALPGGGLTGGLGVLRVGTNITLTVKTAGGDFTTIADAIAYADQISSPSTGTLGTPYIITISIDDGVWTQTTPLSGFRNACGRITGAHSYDKTMSSIVSSAGSAGAWTLILQLDSVANIAVGDYAIVTTPSGGSNPTYITGCFPITNVDALNTRITVISPHKAAAAPSGAVTANVRINKTILSFPNQTDGIRVWDKELLYIDDVVLVGTDTSHGNALSIQDNSRMYNSDTVGIYQFQIGVLLLYTSQFNGATMVVTGCQKGIEADNNSNVGATLQVSGCSYGIQASKQACVQCVSTTIATGNEYGFFAITGSYIDAPSVYCTGNTQLGFYFRTAAGLEYTGATVAGNASDYWPLTITTPVTTVQPLVVQAKASQTAHLTDWKDSAGNVITSVDVSGALGLGTNAPSEKLEVLGNIKASGQVIAPSFQEVMGVISHAGTATLNFSPGANANKLVLTGAVTIAFSNLETNRYYHLMVANAQATNCSYVLPAVTFMGYYPTNIVAGKTAEWFFKVDPQTNSIVYAKYVEQQ